ncbi:MAG: nucleotidyltransferase family protein, partial [Bacteroidales bacterium]|nr:nucleotidyltransferase family protein [Bacteroidales bacterium]
MKMQAFDVNERAFFALVRAGLWGNRVQLDSYREVDFGEVDWMAVDWREVYRLADRQLVAGLVAAGLESLGAMMEGVDRAGTLMEGVDRAGAFVVPHVVAKAFAGATMRLERRSEAMDALVGELVSELRAAGIEALLVKGQGIALCYERPLWRACGDVDLYLDGAQFERAKELFRPRAEKFDCSLPGHVNMHLGHWTVELHADQHCGISPRINRVMDEIHARLFRAGEAAAAAAAAAVAAACAPEAPETSALGAQESVAQELAARVELAQESVAQELAARVELAQDSVAQELAARVELAQDSVAQELAARGSGTRMLGEVRMAEIGGVLVALPSPDNDVLIVFVHFINHFYREGLGIRQVCDWCRLLWTYRDTIDKDLLEKRLRRMGLVGAWRAFGAFAVTHLGMPADAMPLSAPAPAPRQPRQAASTL